MADTIFIYCTDTDLYHWVIKDHSDNISSVRSGDIESLVSAAHGYDAILILPGTETLLTQVSLPTQNRSKILQALPYSLEDQIIEDVEKLHFAIPGTIKNLDMIPVCITSRDALSEPLTHLREAGIHVSNAVSAIHCLTYAPGQWSVLIDEQLTTIRTGMQTGLSFDTGSLTEMFQILLGQTTDTALPQQIHILDCRGLEEVASAYLPDISEEIQVDISPCNQHPLQQFAQTYVPENSINLLQGDFSLRRKRLQLSRKWLPVAALVLISLGLQVTSWISEYIHLGNQLAAQKVQIASLFQRALPGTKKMVNPRAQLQQRLSELQQGVSSGGGNFLGMMAASGAVFSKQKDVTLNAVQYRNRELEFDLVAPDVQTLDVLKQKLVNAKLNVEIRSASASGGQVNGRIKIKGSQ